MKFCSLSFLLSTVLMIFIPGCQTDTSPASKTAAAIHAGAPGPVVTTPSGLRYQVLASGPTGGKSPTINDSVTVHYKGTLTNGTVFDSSYDRGQPITLGVGQVIPGWTEALQLMKPGDQWLIYVPSNFGYGAMATGSIPANSDLIFQIHLLQVNGAP
ncbi:FKBP-type peptidyl-prolyl cis-trans isomerase [Prosthecobacter sp.]|uniref:FKBP-type peptidyl-prolyl cis-trans isomerase n=1 Tax=Prosthecobacter sp. TaxID=1965333 RepID=UPI003783EADA